MRVTEMGLAGNYLVDLAIEASQGWARVSSGAGGLRPVATGTTVTKGIA
jgi:hypothetical protein